MIRNYIRIALRNFVRNKNYTLINTIGLSVGITACIIIFLMVTNELKFDKFHSKADAIYRIVVDSKGSEGVEKSSVTPYPLAKAFRNDIPDVPMVTQLHYNGETLLKHGTDKMMVDEVLFADSLFFEIFDFKTLSGNPRVDLGEPGKVFLTKSLADKLGIQSPGADIKLDNRLDLEVAGIIEDAPTTSHITFSMIVSMPSLTSDFVAGMLIDSWGLSSAGYVYLVLPSSVSETSINNQLSQLKEKYLSKEDAQRRTYSIQKLSDIHFNESYTDTPGKQQNASFTNLMILSVIGFFILVIACINFINLSTALAVKKSKEIGVRKTLGARRGQLTGYLLTETFFLAFLSVIVSLCVCEWTLSWLNDFLDKSLALDLLNNVPLIIFLLSLMVMTTLLAGFYPSMFLSGLNPVAILKNRNAVAQSGSSSLRKVLVVFQFFIAQALVIGTLVVADQMEYLTNKPLGFDKEAIVTVPMYDITPEIMESFRNRLETDPNIQNISYSLGAPTSDNNFSTRLYLTETGRDGNNYRTGVKAVDRHYMETYGIELLAGRWFAEADEKAADPSLKDGRKFNYVINESAMRRLGFNQPSEVIGKLITTGVGDISGEVIGVVKDFHVASLRSEIEPTVLMLLSRFYFQAGIKMNPSHIREAMAAIEKNWTAIYPDHYFDYKFLDAELQANYENDQRTFTLFKIFSGISIFIGCLGLYGLVSFMATQKLKEVGIRKVLGATSNQIIVLFSKEFVRLIGVAFVVAAPLTWYLMNQWLSGFAYRVDVHWSVFVIAIAGTMAIALVTVAYKAMKAAISNPVDSLRTE